MNQKIVFHVQVPCYKCPRSALQIAADACGVESIALEGNEKNQVVVIGEGIDIVKLGRKLRKKIGCTDLVSVSELN